MSRVLLIIVACSFAVGCGSVRTFTDHACRLSFEYPRGWTAAVHRYDPGSCSIALNPPNWELERGNTAYELISEQAVNMWVRPGTVEQWLSEDNDCIEKRFDDWYETCGRVPSLVSEFKTSTLAGISFDRTYGAFSQDGEGGYQGLTSEGGFVLGDGERYVEITVAWCGDVCEIIDRLPSSVTFR